MHPPRRYLTGKPHFRFAPDWFGQMRPERRLGAKRMAPAEAYSRSKSSGWSAIPGILPLVHLIWNAEGRRISAEGELIAQSIFAACADMRSLQLVLRSTHSGYHGSAAATTVCQKSAARKATTIMRRIRPRLSRAEAVSSREISRSGPLMRNSSVTRQRANLTRHS